MTRTTDERLLGVAIEHFGRHGLTGASTRAIANGAGTPMSSITYHFGGKEGLYLAAARHIGAQMRERLAPALEEAEGALSAPDPASARRALHAIYVRVAAVLSTPDIEPIARFIVREQADPTEAFEVIYQAFMAPLLPRVARLLTIVSGGRLEDGEARLRTLTLLGQALVFRVARASVLKTMGWTGIGPVERTAIERVLADHLEAILDRLQYGDAR